MIGHVTESESLYVSNPGVRILKGRTRLSIYRAVPLLRNTTAKHSVLFYSYLYTPVDKYYCGRTRTEGSRGIQLGVGHTNPKNQ